jgi:Domain of Unknown Function with PDB structure (DUF3857)/Transglutaminase-like superfamily
MSSPQFPRRLLLVALLTILIGGSGVAPRAASGMSGGEEWRPITPADLALKTPVVEADADAEAIFWDIRVDDAGAEDLVLSHYIRIKIFTDRGRDKQGKVDIPYFNGTKIKDVAARTVKPDGSAVELTKEDIIERTVVKLGGLKLRAKTFAFANLEPGSIIEYKWKEVISNSSANYMHLDFQREIPIEAVTYHIKPSSGSSGIFDIRPYNMAKPAFEKEKNGFYSTTVRNMPAFHEEPNMPPEDNVRSWAMVNYNSLFSLIGYPLAAIEACAAFDKYLKVDDEIRSKSSEVITGATTPEEKLEKLFLFCRASIKNTNDKTSGFTAEEIEKMKENKKPADTLKRGVGSGIDVNLLFASLARAAGFDARIALLPDRSKRFFDRNVMSPGAIRPTTIAVRNGEDWRFFAPGFHYVTPGMLRWQEEGVDALITDKSSPTWRKTPLSPPARSKETRRSTLRLDEDGTIEGDVTVEYTGHLAVAGKEQNDEDSSAQREETLKETLKGRLSTAELTNIVIENVADPAKPLIFKYHIRVPGYAQRTGKRLFLQPAFFQKGISPLFAASSRKYPIYFHYPWSEDDKVTIQLPRGYVLDNAEAPIPISAGAISRYEVKILVTKDQSLLIYNRNFFFGGDDKIFFPTQSYEVLKQLFDEVNKADNHTITLKQASPN